MKQYSRVVPKFLLVAASLLSLSACTTTEYASHLIKNAGGHNNTANAGNFKIGNPYQVQGTTYTPTETYQYSERGIASWYGPGFHGNRTACGETYDKYAYTAAHRTLQMPSLVRVTNLDNGRSVIVRVNDRGPFAKGRVIDVSRRAAEALGMIGTGTARVQLDLMPEESRAIANAARSGVKTHGVEIAMNETGRLPDKFAQFGSGRSSSGGFMNDASNMSAVETAAGGYVDNNVQPVEREQLTMDSLPQMNNSSQNDSMSVAQNNAKPSVAGNDIFVQVGAFGNESNATRLSDRLASIAPSRVDSVDYSGRTLYKVRLGPMKSVDEADSVLQKVIQSGQSDAAIIVK